MYKFRMLFHSPPDPDGASGGGGTTDTGGGDAAGDGGSTPEGGSKDEDAGSGGSGDGTPAPKSDARRERQAGSSSAGGDRRFGKMLSSRLTEASPPEIDEDGEWGPKQFKAHQAAQRRYQAYSDFRRELIDYANDGFEYQKDRVFKVSTEEDIEMVERTIREIAESEVIPADLIFKATFMDRFLEEAYENGRNSMKPELKGTRAEQKPANEGGDKGDQPTKTKTLKEVDAPDPDAPKDIRTLLKEQNPDYFKKLMQSRR